MTHLAVHSGDLRLTFSGDLGHLAGVGQAYVLVVQRLDKRPIRGLRNRVFDLVPLVSVQAEEDGLVEGMPE